ncbi:MAG: ribosome maturation factor RimM [Clostridia bacterium]
MDFLKIGQIVNTHGIKGEVKIYPYTDDIIKLAKIKKIYLDPEFKLEYLITGSKIIKNMLVFKLSGIDDIEQTKTLMQQFVYIPKEKIKEENLYYVEDLINLDVYVVENDISSSKFLGKLTYVWNNSANDVYEIKTENNIIYIPAIKDVILKIDLENKKMYVKIMEGLI